MMPLTRRQADMKAFIAAHIARGLGAPSFEEMRNGLGFKTKSIVHAHVFELERRGHIKRLRLCGTRNGWAVKRAIEIVVPQCPHCGHALDAAIKEPNSEIRGTAGANIYTRVAGVLDPTMHGAAPEGVSPPHTKAPCAPLTLYTSASGAGRAA
jgi:SOS-response transcriptional repressor LexA